MVKTNRRNFLKLLAAAFTAWSLPFKLKAHKPVKNTFPFTLPALPYLYNALEPNIDEATMRLHHSKHHQAYINALNSSDSQFFYGAASLSAYCRKVQSNTSSLIRNNLGGHYNHSLFWQLLAPAQILIPEFVKTRIQQTFGTMEAFQTQFSEAALKHFGSGWCWLVMPDNQSLQIVTTPNQDNPLMELSPIKGRPLLALDVWEHAYYLKYQNRRAEYIKNWFSCINWNTVQWLMQGNEI